MKELVLTELIEFPFTWVSSRQGGNQLSTNQKDLKPALAEGKTFSKVEVDLRFRWEDDLPFQSVCYAGRNKVGMIQCSRRLKGYKWTTFPFDEDPEISDDEESGLTADEAKLSVQHSVLGWLVMLNCHPDPEEVE